MNATETPSLTEGQRLAGCYTLKASLSQQADNAVWLAQDEVLGKEVTLHFVPSPILRDQRAVAELRQEVKRNRQLIHPNILRVYDYVEDAGSAAVSMDKFEGEGLAEILKSKGGLEPQEIQPWISQLAETLSDAHRIQLIHRDLSPENLIIRPNGSILVTSFGIARSMRDAMERAGLAKGDAAHLALMSPQQIDGERAVPADDVYGLGALIFELLTGRPPFVGNDLVPQIRKAHPPSINSLRADLGKSPVPDSWQSVVDACLAKTPEQRPRSCGEVASMIAGGRSSAAAHAAPATHAVSPASATPASAPTPSRVDIRESAAPSRSAPAETPATTPVESAPAKDSPATSSVKSTLPPMPPSISQKKTFPAVSANFPDLDRPGSKRKVVLVALAAVAVGAGVAVWNMSDDAKGVSDTQTAPSKASADAKAPATSGTDTPANGGNTGTSSNPVNANPGNSTAGGPPPTLTTTNNAGTEPTQPVSKPPTPKPALIGEEPHKTAETPKPAVTGEAPKATAGTDPVKAPAGTGPKTPDKPVKPEVAVAEAPKTPTTTDVAPPPLPEIPAPLPKLVIPTNATLAQLEQIMADRQAAADKLAETAKAAETAGKEAARLRDAKQTEVEHFTKTYEAKKKGLAQIIQSGSAVETQTARMKQQMESAKAAAVEAAKAADAAEKALTEFVAQSGEKLGAQKKAQVELRELVLAQGDVAKPLDDLNSQVTKSESLRTQIALALRQVEQDKKAIGTQLDKAKAAEAEVVRKANKEKIAGIEAQLKPLEAEATKYKNALGQLKDLGPAGVEASKPIQQQLDAVNAKISTMQDEIKSLNGGALPTPTGKPGKHSSGAATAPVTPAKTASTEPPTLPTASVGTNPPTAAIEAIHSPALPVGNPATAPAPGNAVAVNPANAAGGSATAPDAESSAPVDAGSNTLGLKFAPVGSVQFSVYPITRQQFEVFAKSTNLTSSAWQTAFQPGPFQQGPDHPVVNVTWREADAFCRWLTDKERKVGHLKGAEYFRLPTDLEWSKAVGLPEETGPTPEERDMSVANVYPWGSVWPPPAGAGNYCGEETKSENPIQGYNDGFEYTSPVGRFKPTTTGLYDMSGNVYQWVMDDWNKDKKQKTLRGSSWSSGNIQLSLLSSCRAYSAPTTQNESYGFRVVKAADSKGTKH